VPPRPLTQRKANIIYPVFRRRRRSEFIHSWGAQRAQTRRCARKLTLLDRPGAAAIILKYNNSDNQRCRHGP
jgi:hypothetical protein